MTTRPSRTIPTVLALIVAAAGGVLTACSDDDPTGPDATIVGSWEATSFTSTPMNWSGSIDGIPATVTFVRN